MTTLTSEALTETHPNLKPGFRRSMQQIKRRGGPFDCEACGGPSYQCYRCSKCGHNLAGSGGSAGRIGGER